METLDELFKKVFTPRAPAPQNPKALRLMALKAAEVQWVNTLRKARQDKDWDTEMLAEEIIDEIRVGIKEAQ